MPARLRKDATRPADLPHVLLAEDFAPTAKLVEHQLRGLGYAVTRVADGGQAVAALQRQAFDAAVLDYQMPDMDGLAVVARMHEAGGQTGRACVPFVILTADDDPATRIRCGEAGVAAVLTKPTTPARLGDVLKAAIAQTALPHGVAGDTEAPAAIDKAALWMMLGDNSDTATGLARQFQAQSREAAEALAAGDTTRARARLHLLKGSAGMFGFNALASCAGRLESRAASLADHEAAPDTAGLTEAVALAVEALSELSAGSDPVCAA